MQVEYKIVVICNKYTETIKDTHTHTHTHIYIYIYYETLIGSHIYDLANRVIASDLE